MPKMVTELAQGQSFARSSDNAVLSDTAQRVFKVILSSPGEQFNPQASCGIYVGSAHPVNANLVCTDFSARFDGESRMVTVVTFDYKSNLSVANSNNHGNQKQKHPRERPATWTTSSSLYDAPLDVWRRYDNINSPNTWVVPVNPNGERYEGVSGQNCIISIKITQMVEFDPMSHHVYAGYINNNTVSFGSLRCSPHTLLIRGVDVEPYSEPFLGSVWNGFKVSYDVAYRRNSLYLPLPTDRDTVGPVVEVGWDRLQVVEGYRIKNSGLGTAGVDQNALALMHVNGTVVDPAAYANNTQDTVCEASVMLAGRDGGRVQVRASSPVALNDNGTPRDLTSAIAGKYYSPIIVRYQTQPECDLSNVLQLRLQA